MHNMLGLFHSEHILTHCARPKAALACNYTCSVCGTLTYGLWPGLLQDVVKLTIYNIHVHMCNCGNEYAKCTFMLSPTAGLCCLCPNSSNSVLAYPGVEGGHVSLVDLASLDKPVIDFAAHEASLSCIALNLQGSRLATASEKVRLMILFTENYVVSLSDLPLSQAERTLQVEW